MENNEILFELFGRSKYQWLQTAKELIAASNILYNASDKETERLSKRFEEVDSVSPDEFIEVRAFLPARMLSGLALENLIKGLIIIKHPEEVSKDKKFNLNSHKLVELFTKYLPEIPLSKSERTILQELTNHIEWMGKYPIPLMASKFTMHTMLENETTIINGLYSKLFHAYNP